MRFSRVTMLLFLAAPLFTLASQPTAPLRAGDVVRGRLNGRVVQGSLIETPTTAHPLRIHPKGGGDPVDLPWDSPDLARLVHPSRRGQGLLIGAGVGFAGGALLGSLVGNSSCDGFCFSISKGEGALIGGGLLMPFGALFGLGTASGALWAPIQAEKPTVSAMLMVAPGRVGVQLRF